MTLTIEVGFGLPAVIRLRPRRIADIFARLRPSGGSVETGDESIDELFTITVAQGSPALGWLTEPLRRGFVALQKEIGDVELDGHGLYAEDSRAAGRSGAPDVARAPRRAR